MIEPTFDAHGYPTEETERAIRSWQHVIVGPGADALVAFVTEAWNSDFGSLEYEGEVLTLHTGGWSGNESIISALGESPFWALYWQSSTRGGHHVFRVPALTKKERA
jgi:hypothetical protein